MSAKKSSNEAKKRGSRKQGTPGSDRLFKRFGDLPSDAQTQLNEALIDGLTFEAAAEIVSEIAEKNISAEWVGRYFRSNVDVQAARVRKQLDGVRDLKRALNGPTSLKKQLAEAVLLTGLMGLGKSGEAQVQRVFRFNEQQLKQKAHRLKEKKFKSESERLSVRLEIDKQTLDLIGAKALCLKQSIEHRGKRGGLGPEDIQRIQEIYGLASAGAAKLGQAAAEHAGIGNEA